MNQAIVNFATDTIRRRIGISVYGKLINQDNNSIEFSPRDVHSNDSFSILFHAKWRIAEAEFIPGKFAAPLITQMGNASEESKSAFVAFATALNRNKIQILFRINGQDFSPFNPVSWPTSWQKLEIQLHSPYQVINHDDVAQIQKLISDLVISLFGMLVSLIGFEDYDVPLMGEIEGQPIQTLITRYERKKVNREACIQLKGLCCSACGFNFEVHYGQLGGEYIEVHHIIPVSQLGANYQINISTDLVPLCSNCHSMVHRENPPIPINRLREIIEANKLK